MKVKALVLWDPWAWFIRLRLKEYETRSWGTNYRGPLLICAAKRPVDRGLLRYFNEILRQHGQERISISDLYPGHAVALVDLVKDIHCVWSYSGLVPRLIIPDNLSPLDREFGDFSPGRHALKLSNIRDIDPFPVRGRQGLFDVEVPDSLFK
jgi:hypothetical protein